MNTFSPCAPPHNKKAEYDYGGRIQRVAGVKGSHAADTYEYVKDIGYDEFGQRVSITYGNGVETRYTYNGERRWLDRIRTTAGSGVYQDIEYRFDRVGNVKGYENDSALTRTGQEYGYDDLYQLVAVSGESRGYRGQGKVESYHSEYRQDYGFALVHPDAQGSGEQGHQREYQWNERNLLRRVRDSRHVMEYRYGADGERAVKYGSNGNLPGMGGVYNYVNLHVYHYAGNNPVKYIDPDGREIEIEGNLFFKIKTVIALWRVEWNLKKSGDKVALEKFRALKKDPSYIVKIERTDNGNAYDFKNNIILFNDKKKTGGKDVTGDDKQPAFIRGEGLIPRPSGAVIKVLNPRPIPLENNIPRCSAAGLLIGLGHETAHAIDDHEGNIENNVRSPATAPEKYPNRAEEIAVEFENLLRGAYWKNRPEKLRPRY